MSQCRTPCVAMASCRTLATSVRMAVSRPCNAATLAGSMRVNQLAKSCKGLCNAAHCSAYSSFWSYLNILYLNIIFLMLFVGVTSSILIATYFQPPHAQQAQSSPQAQGSLRWAQLAWPKQAKKQVNLKIIHNNSSRPQGWPAGLHLWYAHLPACPKRRFQPGAGRSWQVESAKNEGRWGML